MDFRIDSDGNGQKCFDYFELDLVVTIFGAAADCFDNGINQQSLSLAIHGRWCLALFILAVIWAVSIQEVVAE